MCCLRISPGACKNHLPGLPASPTAAPFHSPQSSQWGFPRIHIRSDHSVRHFGLKIEGHSLQVVQVQGTRLTLGPVLSLTCPHCPLASHGSGNKMQTPYNPAPAHLSYFFSIALQLHSFLCCLDKSNLFLPGAFALALP